jgi:hypothetical protein
LVKFGVDTVKYFVAVLDTASFHGLKTLCDALPQFILAYRPQFIAFLKQP